jgi:hypothetical protein
LFGSDMADMVIECLGRLHPSNKNWIFFEVLFFAGWGKDEPTSAFSLLLAHNQEKADMYLSAYLDGYGLSGLVSTDLTVLAEIGRALNNNDIVPAGETIQRMFAVVPWDFCLSPVASQSARSLLFFLLTRVRNGDEYAVAYWANLVLNLSRTGARSEHPNVPHWLCGVILRMMTNQDFCVQMQPFWDAVNNDDCDCLSELEEQAHQVHHPSELKEHTHQASLPDDLILKYSSNLDKVEIQKGIDAAFKYFSKCPEDDTDARDNFNRAVHDHFGPKWRGQFVYRFMGREEITQNSDQK